MTDDVASFFKTKKSKKQNSAHAIVQTPDELARRLEQTVQQQQLLDRENGAQVEDEFGSQRPDNSQQLATGGGEDGGNAIEANQIDQNKEDSEWLDVEEHTDVDLAKIGIKEMEIREEVDVDDNADEELSTNRKTWNIPGQMQDDKKANKAPKISYAAGMDIDDGEEQSTEDNPANPDNVEANEESTAKEETDSSKQQAEVEVKKPQAYVPPSKRFEQLTGSARLAMKKPDIGDAMEFPSLAAASELEEQLEKAKKKKLPPLQPIRSKPSPSPVNVWKSRSAAAAAASPVQQSEPIPSPAQSQPIEKDEPNQQQPNKYVPPHLRKRAT